MCVYEGAIVFKWRYRKVVTHLWEAVHLKCPKILAPAYQPPLLLQQLAKHGTVVLLHPLYSPDLTPCVFLSHFTDKEQSEGL
jgi:hypothetical protein